MVAGGERAKVWCGGAWRRLARVWCGAVADMKPQQWVRMPEEELEQCLALVKDSALKHTMRVRAWLRVLGRAVSLRHGFVCGPRTPHTRTMGVRNGVPCVRCVVCMRNAHLQFGIGLHHAGLNDRDRSLVERLFVECKIQVSSALGAARQIVVGREGGRSAVVTHTALRTWGPLGGEKGRSC